MSHENCIFLTCYVQYEFGLKAIFFFFFLKLDVMGLMISIVCNTKAQEFVEVPFQGNWPNITSTLIETIKADVLAIENAEGELKYGHNDV